MAWRYYAGQLAERRPDSRRATIATPQGVRPMSTELLAFGLADGYTTANFDGGVHIGDGVLFDLGHAVREGNGVIRTADENVVAALAAHHAFVQVDGPAPQEEYGSGDQPSTGDTPASLPPDSGTTTSADAAAASTDPSTAGAARAAKGE